MICVPIGNENDSLFGGRIINGQIVDISTVPYIVSLINGMGQFCGGTIVTERHVVTAAHCLDK